MCTPGILFYTEPKIIMRINLLLLAVFMAGCWCAHSQNTLSGKVLAGNSLPLDGAHIHIEALHGTTLPDGTYTVSGITTGSHRVIISYIGYKSLDTLVDFHGSRVLNAVLIAQYTQLQEVVVTEAAVSKSTVHEQHLTTQTIEKYSDASLGDALKEIAGVSVLKTGNSIVKPVINGLHSSRVPVISNNVRLEDQQWGTEHAPNLDLNAAGRISVIKGAGALQYGGDAVGGLVLVEPLQVATDTIFGKTIFTGNSNGRGGALSTSLHKGAQKGFAWNAQGTLKYMGDRQAPDYVLSNTGNREANFASDVTYLTDTYKLSAFYSFYNASIGIATATHIGNVADLVRAINGGQPNVVAPFTYSINNPKQEVQHHLAKLNFSKDLADGSLLSLQYAFQYNHRQEYDLRRGDFANTPALDLTLVTHSANADWKKNLGSSSIKAGISAALQHNDASPDTGVRPLIPTYDKYDAGAYGIYSHVFSTSLSAEAGLRYDFTRMDATKFYQKSRWTALGYDGVYDNFITQDFGSQWLTNPTFTFHNISASVGLRKKFKEGLELLGNLSLAMRNPNPSELFSDGLHHSNATIELGNLGLKKEQAFKASATLLATTGNFSLEATPYLNAINNFMYLAPGAVEYTIRGTFPVYSYRQANALLAGMDLHTQWDITKSFTHSLNAAYVHGTNTDADEPLIDMPPLNLTNTIRYSKTAWHNFFAELRSEAIFTQTRYPYNDFFADVPVNGELMPTPVRISTPPKGYHLLHASTGMRFTMGATQTAISLSVFNIFNTNYRDYLNRQRLYTDEVGRNIQLQVKFNY
jgi:iron complex outermembrane receptor protein